MIIFLKSKNKITLRIYKTLLANSFGLFLNVISQISIIPVYISYWGVTQYGEWILLSAIPAYLTSGDLGFCAAAANKISIYGSKGDKKNAKIVFQSGLLLLSLIILFLLIVTSLSLSIIDIRKILNLQIISELDTKYIIGLLSLQIILTIPGELINGGYRSVGRFSEYILTNNVFKLVEFGMVITIITMDGGPLYIALIFFIIRLSFMIYTAFKLRKYAKWLSYGYNFASLNIIKELFKPAAAFAVFPVGNAILSQGVIIAIGAKFDPLVVVTFNTIRVLTRFIITICGMISNSIMSEITFAYGSEDYTLLRNLFRNSIKFIILISMFSIIFLYFFQSEIFTLWMGSKFYYDQNLFFYMLIATFFASLWKNNLTIISACNKHVNISLIYIVSSILLVLLISYCSFINSLISVSILLLIYDILMMVITFKIAFILSHYKIISNINLTF